MPIIYGSTVAPSNTSLGDNTNNAILAGKAGEAIVNELRGKYFISAYRNRLFSATAAGVTIPLITSAVVSVFTLYNPPGSGVNMEMVETTIGSTSATTVVNVVGWYFSTATATAAGTFTTKGTVQNMLVGGAAGQGQFFSSYTHSGTPTLIDIISAYGATTNANSSPPQKLHDGKLVLPPGIAMSIAMGTAAGTTTANTIEAVWAEWPV